MHYSFNNILKLWFKIILFVTFLLLGWNSVSAQKNVTHNNQQWLQYYSHVNFSDKWTLYSDASLRRINNFNQWSQMTLRAGIGYRMTEKLNIATGFAYFNFFTNNHWSRIEYRSYQEVNTQQKIGKLKLQHRFRYELRYFRKVENSNITSTSNFNHRFRYRLFCSYPLVDISSKHSGRLILLNFGDEIFINAGKQIIYNMLDNNRLLLGTTIQINKTFQISMTYAYQFGQRNSPETYEHSDIIWLGITQKFFMKNKKPKDNL